MTISSSGSAQVSAFGSHPIGPQQFLATGNLALGFTVTGGPVDYEASGSVSNPGAPFGVAQVTIPGFSTQTSGAFQQSGTLQPGTYSTEGIASCGASGGNLGQVSCTSSYSFTITLTDAQSDLDGDGLLDSWETDGIDFTDNGSVDLDLPAMGADPQHKDIFLEIDHMTNHALSQDAIDQVATAFADAPVANPDGDQGITLHVDNGPASPMNPPSAQTWGALSDADTVTHQDALGSITAGGYDWSDFDLVKAGNFSVDREPAFHYAISGHRLDASDTSSGVSRGIGASDLLVSLGAFSEPNEGSGTVADQAGTLMHELGHNLGLRHGGTSDFNNKPNYLSMMNYSFQLTGLLRADGTSRLDYSTLPVSLNENALDENNGFGFPAGSEQAKYLTTYGCPNGSVVGARLLAGPVDWNCDAVILGQVSEDVNGDGLISALATVPRLACTRLRRRRHRRPGRRHAARYHRDGRAPARRAARKQAGARGRREEGPRAATGPGAGAAPPGAPPAAPKTAVAPKASLSGSTTQKLAKSISVTVICSEACDASAAGAVSVPNTSKAFKISSPTVKLGKGGSAKLELKLSKKLRAAAKRALKKRKNVKAAITITAKNAAGTGVAKRSIKLKR